MTAFVLLSVQVGMPQIITDGGFTGRISTWETGIFKSEVRGAVRLNALNLEGDGQADLTVHGGVDKAVMAYSADHYPYWRTLYPELPYGGFGENFTVSGMTEENVCIEDVYTLGEAIVQVSQPRQPCWKLARKMKNKAIAAQVITTGYSGWYFRVLQPGLIESGNVFELVSRIQPDWSIARINRNR